jgi:hypothetical protein
MRSICCLLITAMSLAVACLIAAAVAPGTATATAPATASSPTAAATASAPAGTVSKVIFRLLPVEATEAEVRQLCEPFGTIVILNFAKQIDNTAVAHVTMSSPAEAARVVAGLKGTQLHGHDLTVYLERPRSERRLK